MRSPTFPKWFYSRRPLRVPLRLLLILPFLIEMVVAVGLIGYFSYHNTQHSIHNITLELRSEMSGRVAQYLDTYLNTAYQVNEISATEVTTGELDINNVNQLEQHLLGQLRQSNTISQIAFTSPNGRMSIATRHPQLQIGRSVISNPQQIHFYALNSRGETTGLRRSMWQPDPQQELWYRQVVRSGQAQQFIHLQDDRTKFALITSHPVYSKTGEILGVFSVKSNLEELQQFISGLTIGRKGRVFVVDRNGYLISSSADKPALGSRAPSDQSISRHISASDSSDLLIQSTADKLLKQFHDFSQIETVQNLTLSAHGSRSFVQVAPYTFPSGDKSTAGANWLIGVVLPEADFMVPIWSNTQINLLLLLGALIVATALGLLTADWIARPIRQLSRASRDMMLGEWRYPLKQESHIAELEVLTHSYNQMAQQIEVAFDEIKAALQESEEKFTKAFRLSPDPMAILSLSEERFLEVNDSLLEFMGIDREDIIGRTPTKLNLWLNRHDRDRFRLLLKTHRSVRNLEVNARNSEGEICTALLSADLTLLDGQTCIIAIARDITERKQLEIALQNSEAKLNQIFSNAIAAISSYRIFSDRNFEVIYFSPGHEAVCGFTPEELAANPFLGILRTHPEDLQRIVAPTFEAIFTHQTVSPIEFRFQHKDGNWRWLSCHLTPKWETDTNSWLITSVIVEITERKLIETERQHAEEALRASETRYRAIVETQTELILRSTPEAIITFVNEAVCRISGFSRSILVGEHWQTFVHPDDWPEVWRQFNRLSPSYPSFVIENRCVLEDGKIGWFRWTNQGVFGSHDELLEVQSVGHDITEHRRVQAALQQNEDLLQQVIQFSSNAIWVWDVVAGVTLRSARFYELLGYSPEDIMPIPNSSWAYRLRTNLTGETSRYLQDDWVNRIHPDDIMQVFSATQDCFDRITPYYQIAYRLRCRNGHYRWMQSRGIAVWNEEGEPQRMVGSTVAMGDRPHPDELIAPDGFSARSWSNIAFTQDWF